MTRRTHLSPQQLFHLDLACKPIREAYGSGVYLVGSVMERPDFRDVDVRLILEDDEYERLVPTPEIRTLLCVALSAYLAQATGLPIDFGIQRRLFASRLHGKRNRNPLGVRTLANWTGDATEAMAEGATR